MNLWDVLIILAVAALCVPGLRQLFGRKQGGCHGSCSCCNTQCEQKQEKE